VRVVSPALFGVLGDTHASADRTWRIVDHVGNLFQRAGVDLILHAGDVGQATILKELQQIAPVVAVRGNADSPDLIESLPDQVWIEVGSRTALLLHGHRGKTGRAAARAAAQPGIDLIVYGHSHKPLIEREGDTILFNPGSPTERRWNPHFGVGLIAVSDESIEPELVLFDDPQHLKSVSF
jgi:putative phosphoesterase